MAQEKTGLAYVMDILKSPIQLSLRAPKTRRRVKRRQSPAVNPSYVQPFFLNGTIERGSATSFAVGGEDIVIDNDTWIFGEVRFGAVASVKGERRGNQNFAKKVVVS